MTPGTDDEVKRVMAALEALMEDIVVNVTGLAELARQEEGQEDQA